MGKYFVSYIRVSTTKQSAQGLGMDAQRDMCERFVSARGGEICKEFSDVESGKSTTRKGLWDAIEFCKTNDMPLVIARMDRLARNVEFTFKVINTGIEIHFTDMPMVNTMILGVFASVAQYERELIALRTKQAFDAKRKRGEAMGGSAGQWGKHTNKNEDDREKMLEYAREKSAESTKLAARNNPHNKAFAEFMGDWQKIYGKVGWRTDWNAIVAELNKRGKRTATGLEFTVARAKAMWLNVNKNFKNI